MNDYPCLTRTPEKDETLVVACCSLRKNSPSHQSQLSTQQVSPGTDHYDSYWVDANADESPQRLFTETDADLDGGGPKSVHNPHWNGNRTLIKTARMETTNEDTTRKSVINTSNVPDAANMEECFTNASESEAPDYSSVLCMQAFDFEGNEPRDKKNTRFTNGAIQAKNSTAFGSYQETDQSHVHVRRQAADASPRGPVRALHPAMFSKQTALVDRLIDEWERLPMFQSDERKSSRTLMGPTMTDGRPHVMQTFTPPTESVRGDGTTLGSCIFESASTNEEEQPNETGNVHPRKIRKVSDKRQVLARGTTTSDNPVSPDAEQTGRTDGYSHVLQTLTPPAEGAHGDDTLGPCIFESDEEEQTNESSNARTNKIRKGLKKRQVLARGRTGDNPVSPDEDFQRAWMLVGNEEPDRSVDTINNKTGSKQVPVTEHKQPPHNGRSLPPPNNSQQKHSQTERSQYPTTMHQRERPSLKAPAHLAANQLLCQTYGSCYSAPWSLLQRNTRMVALTKPPPESPRHPPQRKKQSVLYKKRPYEPKYSIVDITADGWDGMVTRLKNFKGWHGVSRSNSSSVALSMWLVSCPSNLFCTCSL